MPETVAAVVVTYNRSRLLMECLDALLRQTRRPDRIVLIDNASSDDTRALLKSRSYLEHPLIDYVCLSRNVGGAGGFHEGMKRAVELGMDWIWIMDDDAEPYADALELMQPGFGREDTAAVANLTLDLQRQPQLEHRGWLQVCGLTPRAHRAIAPKELAKPIDISFCSFVGLAVRRSTVTRIGLPRRELFLKADDLDYCIRIATVGPILLIPESKILHKDGVSAHFQTRRRLGLGSRRVPLQHLWLGYFSVRNLIWLRRQQCGSLVAAIFSARQLLRHSLGIIIFDSDRFTRLRFYYSAVTDAWRDVFDNDKPRRLTTPAAHQVSGCDPAT